MNTGILIKFSSKETSVVYKFNIEHPPPPPTQKINGKGKIKKIIQKVFKLINIA